MTFTSPTSIRTSEVAGRGTACKDSPADMIPSYR
jgi:hypothetical protein